ncbi:MAG: helix-turn-helix transcriptional regulator [Coriobacteriia bacterium]
MTISIRGARADKRLTQQQVAEHLGVSLPTYGQIENNPERITWAQAKQLAELFGRPIEEFSFCSPTPEESEPCAEDATDGE